MACKKMILVLRINEQTTNMVKHMTKHTMLQLKPLGNRVLAKRLEQEKTSMGGIILPDSAKKKQEIAEVIACGPGSLTNDGHLSPMPVKVGDKILLDKYSAQEINYNDQDLIIIKSDDIVAIVQE
jgi:chaperonin GroES